MNNPKNLLDKMRDMQRQLREGGPQAATVAIQRALQDAGLASAPKNDYTPPHRTGATPPPASGSSSAAGPTSASASAPGQPVMHDINPPPAGKAAHSPINETPSSDAHKVDPAKAVHGFGKAPFSGGEANNFVNDLLAKLGVSSEGVLQGAMAGRTAPQELPEGAQFLSGSFGNAAGSRQYKLYVPASAASATSPLPLVVMLHGCTQDPDDFAAGTQMNSVAETQACLVLYPQQSQGANSSKCWNWFNANDQQRDAGEPSIIAGMTRQIMGQHPIDPSRVYVAGLSAGGAMAAILGIAYPDLYAGVAVHSGLPVGSATDLPSALAAMRSGVTGAVPRPGATANNKSFKGIPVIVFHGDADHTVHRRNGEQVIDGTAPTTHGAATSVSGQVPNGHAYTRTVHHDAAGTPVAEHWLIHGFGHAWAGGSARGSYTDARGPDASGEMMRFFETHRKPS